MEKALRGGEDDNSTEAWRQGKRVNIHVKIISIKIIIKMTEDITNMMLKVPLVRKDSWRKPRGVVNVVSAFGNKKEKRKEGQRHKEIGSKHCQRHNGPRN